MSEAEAEFEHAEVPEAGPVSVDDVLQAIQQKNIGRAKAAFGDVMAQKVNDALESEKVKIAADIFNGGLPEEEEEPTAELESEEEVEETEEPEEEIELSLEDEVESAFDEEEEEDAEDN